MGSVELDNRKLINVHSFNCPSKAARSAALQEARFCSHNRKTLPITHERVSAPWSAALAPPWMGY